MKVYLKKIQQEVFTFSIQTTRSNFCLITDISAFSLKALYK